MRTKGLAVGAYYSKADWHSHSFWDPAIGFPSDRNVNYNISNNATKCKNETYMPISNGIELNFTLTCLSLSMLRSMFCTLMAWRICWV